MKCGEMYTFEIDGRKQSIRKEKDYYVCFVEPVLELLHLQEHTFQVLKCTLEGRMEELKDWISRHYLLTGDQLEKSIAYIQRELIDVCLLSRTDRHLLSYCHPLP
jgi:hypothetical protein